jgi:hypothetical protein
MAYAVKEERQKPLKWFTLAWLPLGTFWWDKKEKWRQGAALMGIW